MNKDKTSIAQIELMGFLTFFLSLIITTGLQAQAIEVKDSIGETVLLELPAQRIISLAPHLTENLYAAGAGSRLVGAVSFSDYPEPARSVARVGSYNNVNIEIILSLKPDLVVAWKEGNQKQQVQRLKALGLTVYIDAPEKLEDIAISLRNFGKLTALEESANRAADHFVKQLSSLEKKYLHEKQLSVFYQAWNSPLITVNNRQFIGQIISLCGGRNIFGDLDTLSPKVSVESVIQLNPQVIITSGMDEARPEWLDDWKRWPFLDAVQAKRLFFVPPDILQRHTPRLIQGASVLCGQLSKVRTQQHGQ